MANIAEIGFAADTGALADAKADLKALVPPAQAAEKAADSLSDSLEETGNAAAKAAAGVSNAAKANRAAAGSYSTVAAAVNSSAHALDGHTRSSNINRMQMMELQHVTRSLFDSMAAGISPVRALTMESGRLAQIFSGSGGLLPGLKAVAIQFGLLKSTADPAAAAAAQLAAANDVLRQKYNPLYAALVKNKAALADINAATAAGALTAEESAIATNAANASTAAEIKGLTTAKIADTAATDAITIANAEFAVSNAAVAASAGEVEAASAGVIAANEAVAASAEAAGVAEGVAFAPLGAIILGIVAMLSLFTAGFGLAAHAIKQSSGDIAQNLGLSAQQMDKLKEKGTKTFVTLGDTFKGFFMAIGDEIKQHAGGGLDWLAKKFNDVMAAITSGTVAFIKGFLGFFVGSFDAIVAVFGQLPAVLGDLFYTAANGAISAINWLINKVVDGINALGGHMQHMDLVTAKNPFTGAAGKATLNGISAFKKGMDDTNKSLDNFGKLWSADTQLTAQKRIVKAAGKAPKTPKGHKTDAEKFSDIITGGNNDVATEVAKGDATMQVSIKDAAAYEEQIKLVNEATKAGIPLDGARMNAIEGVADAFGKAALNAANGKFMKEVNEDADKQISTLTDAGKTIGVYGEALATATAYQGFMNKAIAAGIPITDQLAASMLAKAQAIGKLSASNDVNKFMTDQAKASDASILALQQEQSYIGMNADAVARLTLENQRLAAAKQANINLSPAQIATIKAEADAEANMQIAINKTKEAISFAQDLTKGFVDDMRTGLQQGEGFWKSFGNAVINVLQKIIDKLLDKELDNLFTGGAPGAGGGGFLKSLTNAFTTLFSGGSISTGIGGGAAALASGIPFANGGAFTNSVVSKPTAFAHAQGLGVMGEAGPEAVMPLTRGPDGSLGVANHGSSAPQRVQVGVSVQAIPSDDLYLKVQSIAQDTANDTTKQGLSEYNDKILPARIQQLAADPRKR